MSAALFSGIVFAISMLAGYLGSLTGLGGGVIITPALTLLLGVGLHFAMGASLVSVVATSSGAAAAYIKEGYTNVRPGMFLEIATTLGAIAGAHLTAVVPAFGLAVTFGGVLLYSAWQSLRGHAARAAAPADPMADRLRLNGSYRGYIEPRLAMPVMLGVLSGSLLGARRLVHAEPRLLRRVFAGVIVLMAVEMIWSGVTGGLQ